MEGPVDVRVDHSDAPAFPGEVCREIGGNGALADAALAAHHRDGVPHAGHAGLEALGLRRHLGGDVRAAVPNDVAINASA